MEKENNQPIAPEKSLTTQKAQDKSEQTHAQRFTAAVEREFSANNGEAIKLTTFQKKLIQGYFIKVDMVLTEAERKRLAKDEKWRDVVPVTWQNVNMQRLTVDVIAYSAIGLDPAQPNHINPIPYKNNGTGKYDITFIMGYRGIELKSRKYGLDVPDDVVVELVYENDTFKEIKKDNNNPIGGYIFVINDSFNRGDIVGGFYCHRYFDKPEKNKIRVFSRADIDKRKPDKASAEFWGGEKDVWQDGKKIGKEQVEGWYDEMAWKTICRAAYNDITIDSEKIDDHFWRVIERESARLNDYAIEERDTRVMSGLNEAPKIEVKDVDFEEVGQQPAIEQRKAEPQPQPQSQSPSNDLFKENESAPY